MKRAKRSVETLFLWVALLIFFGRIAVLGVDPHHDGMILQPALVVADGGTVHRSVYEQYGVLTPWLHGLAVAIFGRTLTVVRLSSAAMLSGGLSLMFASWRDCWGRRIAYASIIFCICTAYFLTPGMDMRAWSSDTLVLLQGASIWVGLRAATRNDWRLWALMGVLSTGATMSRLAPGLVQVVLTIVVCSRRGRKVLLAYVGTCGMMAGLLVCYLMITHSLDEWWYQTVEIPFGFATTTVGVSPFSFVVGVAIHRVIPVLIGPAAVGLMLSRRRIDKKIRRWLNPILMVLTVYWILTSTNLWSLSYLSRRDAVWTSLVIASISSLSILARFICGRDLDPRLAIHAAIMVAAASQVYPVVEARHLWWSALPSAGILFATISLGLKRPLAIAVISAIVGLPMLSSSMMDLYSNLSIPRVRIEGIAVLRGMYFDRNYYQYFRENFQSLASYKSEHPTSPIINLCADGLFASLTGSSEMPDPYYVEWTFREGSVSDRHRQTWVMNHDAMAWICPPSPDEYAVAESYHLRVVPVSSSTRNLPKWREWPYLNVLAVPKEWPIAKGARG